MFLAKDRKRAMRNYVLALLEAQQAYCLSGSNTFQYNTANLFLRKTWNKLDNEQKNYIKSLNNNKHVDMSDIDGMAKSIWSKIQ